ncbi:hypothetical protein Pan241w_32290 [Gimesia alba]|uniref:Rhamnogalacturonan lyase domain-containing protein n=1 Tax=Gimesia alba TaxID=2527973 RepID=A0A517RGX3_9PLAN|nr:hypothetical protein [Gimesia alba]QDT43131.1 hypothetical protein Pan241w_32290 [Gimesia alba]
MPQHQIHLSKMMVLIGIVLVTAHPALAAEWGSLSGHIIYTGKPEKPAKVKITKDQKECCRENLHHLDESFLIGKNGGVKNVFVYLKQKDLNDTLIHPGYRKLPSKVNLNLKSCVFQPHACGLWLKHQKLLLGNQDRIGHNPHFYVFENETRSTLPPLPGTQDILTFYETETLPIKITCDIHPWESAYLLIQNHPYFTITDEAGYFKIKNLPVGKWEFLFWHEEAGYVVYQDNPKRGGMALEIKPGKNDLSVIKVTPELFDRSLASKE